MLGAFLRDVIARNPENFRLFGPDETASNRLGAVFEVDRPRRGRPRSLPTDEHLAPDGRVMEVLSEHLCQGWLEGYLLTGRHGLFNCYEAFIHIVDSMFNQHAKWLKVTRDIPWRRPIASLNYLLSLARLAPGPQRLLAPGSRLHRPRREQEGGGHPRLPAAGREHAALGRRPLPAQPRLRERDRRRQAAGARLPRRWTTRSSTARAALGIWDWASNDDGGEPDVVLACCGDVPTLETLAAAAILREHLPELKVRVVNVVDLMRLQPESEHPHGLSDAEFDALFTHRPAGRLRLPRLPVADPPPHLPAHEPRQPPRARLQGGGHDDDAVRHGHAQRPRPLPPRDRRDRPRARARATRAAHLRQEMVDARLRCRAWTREHGEDHPDVRDWTWPLLTRDVLVVNAGSTSLKLHARRRTDDVAPRSTSLDEAPATSTRSATASCTAARASASRCVIDDDVRAAIARAAPSSRRCTTRRRSRRSSDARARAAGRAARRRLRHGVPRDDARRRRRRYARAASAGATSGASAATASTGSRCSGRPSRCAVPRLVVCHLGGGSLGDGRARRPLGRHDDGLHARSRACRWRRARARSTRARSLYLLREHGLDVDELDHALEHESGLAALGGLDDPLGFAVYVPGRGRRRRMAVALGGLDAIAFTGGVGENRTDVRERDRRPPSAPRPLRRRGRPRARRPRHRGRGARPAPPRASACARSPRRERARASGQARTIATSSARRASMTSSPTRCSAS